MEIAAVIPARGGSKGIRYKNIVPFLGNPLIAYTIEQANATPEIDRTYVSTGDERIASVSRDHGGTVIERPPSLATDTATTESALLHAFGAIQESGMDPDIIVLLQCTSPLRRKDDISNAISLVETDSYDSALSVCEDHKFYWNSSKDSAQPINYDPKERSRRQDLESRYQENGSIYVATSETLITEECRIGGRIGLYEMPESLSFEIDTEEDLKIVEALGQTVSFYSGNLEVDSAPLEAHPDL